MKEQIKEPKICPICGNEYKGYPALSRADNETYICADCGVRQALQSLEISPEEQEKIIVAIHRSDMSRQSM